MITVVKPADPARPTPLVPAYEPPPVTGPTPTNAERRAAQERLALHDDRDTAAAQIITDRLSRLARWHPAAARDLTTWLAAVVDQAATTHGPCTTVGCTACLYLTDARATAQAWKDGPTP